MSMDTFTAIDFETAQGYRWSICQVGLVRFERGIITKEVNLLVKPPENYYWSRFMDIHSISFKNTLNTPTFDQVRNQIATYKKNQNVIAHIGFGFDFPVLDKTLGYYNLPTPGYNKFYTYKIYRSNLANLCAEHNIELNHHNALRDVRLVRSCE